MIVVSVLTRGVRWWHAERYRADYNTVRPHEALSWNHPVEVHTGLACPARWSPTFPSPKFCQLLDAGHGDLSGPG